MVWVVVVVVVVDCLLKNFSSNPDPQRGNRCEK